MTTQRTSALFGATARAIAEVRGLHCKPPEYRPVTPVRASIRCAKCGGLLTFTVSAIDGRTTGRCSSIGCITWNDL